MKTENRVLMEQARESLKGKWGLTVGTFFVYMLIILIASKIPKVGGVVSILIAGPFVLGMVIFSLAISRNTGAKFEQMFEGFKQFSRALVAYVLVALFVILWMLLLIVPGIIAALGYSQTFFILADDRSIGVRDAMRKSKKMMDGYKWKYFCLQLRFIGWALLSILTLGVGFLWLVPYIQISQTKFYDDLKEPVENIVQI
jgi:uncharacterized membrane protein